MSIKIEEDLSDDPKILQEKIKTLEKEIFQAHSMAREEILRETNIFNNQLTRKERESIENVFRSYDRDGDGEISIGELGNFFKALGEPLTEMECREAIELMSKTNSTGKIQLNDFISFWLGLHNNSKSSNFIKKFKLANSILLKADHEFNADNILFHRSGEDLTLEFRVNFFYAQGTELRRISPWHDIPLYNTGYGESATILHMVNEIPKYTRAKYEIATREAYNPIRQDVRNGRVRFYEHGDLSWNYGALPQTYEDPLHISPETGYPGDNDPLDVVEIGIRQIPCGAVVPVKILGIMALIDDGETDWKCIAISVSDPMAHLLNSIQDVEKELPGLLYAIQEYFRKYKMCTGKAENSFALNEEVKDRKFALKIIVETHEHWKRLREKENAPPPAFISTPKSGVEQ